MSNSTMTMNDMVDSLTGYEEEAIFEHYGAAIGTLLGTNGGTRGARALVHIDAVRGGASPADAKSRAMALTIGNLNDYFADEDDEPFPEEPSSEQGKDDSSEPSQTTS